MGSRLSVVSSFNDPRPVAVTSEALSLYFHFSWLLLSSHQALFHHCRVVEMPHAAWEPNGTRHTVVGHVMYQSFRDDYRPAAESSMTSRLVAGKTFSTFYPLSSSFGMHTECVGMCLHGPSFRSSNLTRLDDIVSHSLPVGTTSPVLGGFSGPVVHRRNYLPTSFGSLVAGLSR